MKISTKIFNAFAISLIIIAVISTRINTLNRPIDDTHSWRQSEIYAMAINYSKDLKSFFTPKEFNIRPINNIDGVYLLEFPIYEYILGIIIRIFGNSLLYLRIFTLVLVFITSVSTYIVGKNIVNKYVGLFSAIIINLFPSSIFWGRSLSNDYFATAIATVAIAVLSISKNRYWLIILASTLLGICIAVKPTYAVFVLLIPFFINLKILKKKRLWLFPMFLALFTLPAIWQIRRELLRDIWEHSSYLIYISNGSNLINFLNENNYFETIVKDRIIGQTFSPLGGLVILFMIPILLRSKNRIDKLLLAWIGLTSVPLLLLPYANFEHDYYVIMMLPIASIILGYSFFCFIKMFIKMRLFYKIIYLLAFLLSLYFLGYVSITKELDSYFSREIYFDEFSEDVVNISAIITKNKYVGVINYSDVGSDPIFINRLERKGWSVDISKSCDKGEWNDVLTNPSYKLINYYVIEKVRYRIEYINYCDYKTIEDFILNLDDGLNIYKKVYEGNNLILIEKASK